MVARRLLRTAKALASSTSVPPNNLLPVTRGQGCLESPSGASTGIFRLVALVAEGRPPRYVPQFELARRQPSFRNSRVEGPHLFCLFLQFPRKKRNLSA